MRASTAPKFSSNLVSRLVIHSADQSTRAIEIGLGFEAWSFELDATNPKPPQNAVPVWNDPTDSQKKLGARASAFMITWVNPSPEVEVRSVDFISALSSATPYIYAITAEP